MKLKLPDEYVECLDDTAKRLKGIKSLSKEEKLQILRDEAADFNPPPKDDEIEEYINSLDKRGLSVDT